MLLNRTSLIAILRLPFCCLQSFSITGNDVWSRAPLNWNDFSSELKDTLSTVIHSSTLKTLYLNKVRVPIMLFLGINFTKLGLTALESCPTILMANSQGCWHRQLRKEWQQQLLTRWLITVWDSLHLLISHQFTKWKVPLSRCSCQPSACFRSLHPPIFRKIEERWHLVLLDSFTSLQRHISNSTSYFQALITTSITISITMTVLILMSMPGAISTLLSLIQLIHGYKELTFTFNKPFGTMTTLKSRFFREKGILFVKATDYWVDIRLRYMTVFGISIHGMASVREEGPEPNRW